jgi:hypothetical protein
MTKAPEGIPASALRLLHYWWPLALGWSVTTVVQRATARTPDPTGLAMLLLGICAAYSLDRLLDAPPQQAVWLTKALALAAVGAGTCCVLLLLRLPLKTAALVPLFGVVVLLYPFIKRFPLSKAVAVPVIWTWSTIALPFHDGSWFGWRSVMTPIAVPLFLLIAAGCLLCDLKDEERDRRSEVSSLPVLFGAQATTVVALALALGAAGLSLAEHRRGLAFSGVALCLAGLYPSLLARESVGPLLVDVILSLPGLLTVIHLA